MWMNSKSNYKGIITLSGLFCQFLKTNQINHVFFFVSSCLRFKDYVTFHWNSIDKNVSISGSKDETLSQTCSKSVKPNIGRSIWLGEYEGDVLGLTGQFTKEAAIICGGKNWIDNLNTCYEYDHIQNE